MCYFYTYHVIARNKYSNLNIEWMGQLFPMARELDFD